MFANALSDIISRGFIFANGQKIREIAKISTRENKVIKIKTF